MSDDLFTKTNPGEFIKVGKAAERLAEPGVSTDYAAGQLRGLAAKGLVYCSDTRGDGKVVHKLYSLPDLGVAKILSILTANGGVSKPQLLQWVQAQLYGWPSHYGETDKRYRGPIQAAMAGTARGEFWVCRIDILQSDQSGNELVQTYLYDMDAGLPKAADSGEFLPRLTLTIPLFLPFTRLLSDRTKAN